MKQFKVFQHNSRLKSSKADTSMKEAVTDANIIKVHKITFDDR
jgi:hypothetical protein